MEMPVNGLQQAVAGALVGGYAYELWFVVGAAGVAGLACLALLPLLPATLQDPIRGNRYTRAASSDQAFLFFALALIVILRLPGLSQLQVNPDESNLILSARTLLQDLRFWISVEVQAIGPVSVIAVMLPGVFGLPIDYTTIKVMAILTWCIVAVAMFIGFRWLYSGTYARVFVLPLVVTAATFNYLDYVAFNGEHMSIMLLAFAFLLHARLLNEQVAVLRLRSIMLGAILALIPFTKIQAGPIAVVWGVVACLQALGTRPIHAAYYMLGAMLVGTLAGVYFVVSGAWHDFWQSYILNNLLYAQVGWNATHKDTSLLANFISSPRYFLKPPDTRGLFLFAVLVLVLYAARAFWSRDLRRSMFARDKLLALALVGVTVVAVLLPKNNWTHYLLLLVIPISMLTAASLSSLFGETESRGFSLPALFGNKDTKWQVPANLVAGLVLVALGGLGALYSMYYGNPAMKAAAENLRDGRIPDAVTATILKYAAPGTPVAHWGLWYAELSFAGVSLATREAHNERAIYPSEQQQYYLDRWVSDVMRRKPVLVVDSGRGEKFEAFRLVHYPQQHAEVLSKYVLVEEVEGFQFYVRREDAPQ